MVAHAPKNFSWWPHATRHNFAIKPARPFPSGMLGCFTLIARPPLPREFYSRLRAGKKEEKQENSKNTARETRKELQNRSTEGRIWLIARNPSPVARVPLVPWHLRPSAASNGRRLRPSPRHHSR